MNVSQTALEQVIRDIQTGNDAEYVASFFAARPDWLQDDESSEQTNEKQAEKAS